MKRLILIVLLLALAYTLAGCGAIARIEEARSDRESAVANAEWARTERVRIAEHAHTERIMILSNERLALAAQQGDGTNHEGGISGRIDVGAGFGIGWPIVLLLGAAVVALMVWPARGRSR